MKKLMILVFILAMLSCKGEMRENEKFIGIQLWSVRHQMKEDPGSTLKALGEMGYKFIEAASYEAGRFYGMDPVEFKELVEAHGMRFLGSHVGKDAPGDENYDEVMAWWDEAIAAHKAAGVEYIAQPSMGHEAHASLKGLQRYCSYFNELGRRCNDAGIRFGFHNHADEFKELEGVVMYDYMLQNTDPDKVMFQMDLYWVQKGGKDPVDYIQRYPGRFENWHVKDEAEVGASGTMDFERIFAYKEKAGVKHIVVEVENYNFEPLESVKRSFDFLKEKDYVRF
jgi:sugar phosphate isomerase/epimerase